MNRTDESSLTVRIAAVGDLLLTPGLGGTPYLRSPSLISPEIHSLFGECDVVFGNLECTLPGDDGCVPTEPRVVSNEQLVRAVKKAGFDIVSLANNHMFDCLESGFADLRSLLDEIGLPYFGAGMNLAEATAPAVLERGGLRIALLGAVDERSGPYRFAATNQSGVAPLDTERLVAQIGELRSHVDHVLVSIHWGEERFLVPSPKQISQAGMLVDAGASMVLGHHPHVLQGLEVRSGAPIIYSLGNFIADDVPFSDGDSIQWNRAERTGCILRADLTRDGVENVRQTPTYDSGRTVEVDGSRFGQRRLEKARRAIAKGVTLGRYRREHLWVKTIKPILHHLRWSEIRRLRYRQVINALDSLVRALRAR